MVIKSLPLDKMPIVIAGGSFNARGIHTNIEEEGVEILEKLVKSINPEKSYFVIGHKISGYEKQIIEICKKYRKNW